MFDVFHLLAMLFGVIGVAGAIMAGSTHRKTRLMIRESKTVDKLLPASSPYRTLAPPPEATAVTDASDVDPALDIMTELESKAWTRRARDRDNKPPWEYVYGDFVLTVQDELSLRGTPTGIPNKWVANMRKRIEGEMSGRSNGPTRRSLLAEARGELLSESERNSQ
jgi:hypothetical protein